MNTQLKSHTAIEARPRNPFSWSYRLSHQGDVLTDLVVDWFGEGASFDWNGDAYQIVADLGPTGGWRLVGPAGEHASASRARRFARRINVLHGERTLALQALGTVSTTTFGIFEDGLRQGTIRAPSPRPSAELNLPQGLPVPVRVFVFALAVFVWRR